MSKLGTFVREAIHNIIDPNYAARQSEAEYLRTVYRDTSNIVVRRNQWYRLMNENANLVGFEYVCTCGQSYQLLDTNLWTQEHSCPTCKNNFDLFKTVGITKDTPRSEWPYKFAQLPMRPRITGAQRSPFMDTWAESNRTARTADVEYETYDPGSSSLI